jgi:group II intron reverse transcriptase/maturase
MSTVEVQITARVKEHPGEALTNLHSFIDESMLGESFRRLNKRGSAGVDGQTWQKYNEQMEDRIPVLYRAFKSGTYRAPNILRKYIPKGDGRMRPLGLPTVEDKILQSAVTRVLTPIYEQEFYDFSYGFREGKSQHQALDRLFREVSFEGKRYIIDADMRNYFGTIDHVCMREFLDQRIKDGVIRKQIDKWLKAGVLEDGQVQYPESGTPQGGTISPLLSNIYLHYVLDVWFAEQIQPLLQAGSSIIRFADDFLLCFENKSDADRVLEVLPKRLGKYGLELHPDKTKLIALATGMGEQSGPGTFDFLGFTHYMGKSRNGKVILKRKTSSKKFRQSLRRMNEWLRSHRHQSIGKLVGEVNLKLRGHYNYYGVTFNFRRLDSYYNQVLRLLHKWLNRRGGRRRWTWKRLFQLISSWHPLLRPRIYHTLVK